MNEAVDGKKGCVPSYILTLTDTRTHISVYMCVFLLFLSACPTHQVFLILSFGHIIACGHIIKTLFLDLCTGLRHFVCLCRSTLATHQGTLDFSAVAAAALMVNLLSDGLMKHRTR